MELIKGVWKKIVEDLTPVLNWVLLKLNLFGLWLDQYPLWLQIVVVYLLVGFNFLIFYIRWWVQNPSRRPPSSDKAIYWIVTTILMHLGWPVFLYFGMAPQKPKHTGM